MDIESNLFFLEMLANDASYNAESCRKMHDFIIEALPFLDGHTVELVVIDYITMRQSQRENES